MSGNEYRTYDAFGRETTPIDVRTRLFRQDQAAGRYHLDGPYDDPRCKAHDDSTYEAAILRMEAARRACRKAKAEAERIIRAADAEWDAADANLTRFEASPGIPRPGSR